MAVGCTLCVVAAVTCSASHLSMFTAYSVGNGSERRAVKTIEMLWLIGLYIATGYLLARGFR